LFRGNINAVVIAIAKKAADILLGGAVMSVTIVVSSRTPSLVPARLNGPYGARERKDRARLGIQPSRSPIARPTSANGLGRSITG